MNNSTTVIGCGLMGSEIARVLHGKRVNVTAFNRSLGPLLELAQQGMRTSTDIIEAIAASDILIVVLSHYEAVKSVLTGIGADILRGKLIINLTSGSSADAREMAVRMEPTGASYLDGSIWVLPSMIGDTETVICVGGDKGAWAAAEPVVKLIGGASFHAGTAIESGNVLEACFPGSFYMTAQSCFIESVRLARKSGIGSDAIARAVSPSLRLLKKSLDDVCTKIDARDDSTKEATLNVYLNAARSYGVTADGAGLSSPYLRLLLDELEQAVAKGHGADGPSALLRDD